MVLHFLTIGADHLKGGGSAPETVKQQLAELVAKYQPDELILTGQIHNHEARKRSFTIAAEVLNALELVAA